MTLPLRMAALLLFAGVYGCADEPAQPASPADLLLINARVYTLDWEDAAPDGSPMPGAPHDENGWHPDADAIAIEGDTIVFVGNSGDGYGFNESLNAEAMKAGFQIAIHAIGDAGNREALDILERVVREEPASASRRHRIEHAQVLHPDDLPRIGALGFIASMEPPHAMEDRPWAEERLGPRRILGAYAWRSLRRSGAALTFNSDNPGSDHSIFYGLHSAITRRDKNGQPDGGWYAGEAVGVEEAVRAYTEWAAYASFRERHTGIIASGRWADLTVMDIDPFAVADSRPGDLLDGRILMTIVNGDIAHERIPHP